MLKNTMNKLLFSVSIILSLNSPVASSLEIGIGTHFQSYSSTPETYISLIKELGFTSFRDDYPWSKTEGSEGVYSVSKFLKKTDYALLNADRDGLNPLVILDYGNKLYNKGGYPTTERDIQAFANYAGWVSHRYKGKVKYYEIWNEWTIATGMVKYRNQVPSANVYYNLVKKTSEVIKRNDPNAIILAGSINPLDLRARYIDVNDWKWFEQLVNLGILNYIDGVSLHTYSFMNGNPLLHTPQGNLNRIDAFHTYFTKKTARSIDVYITEAGVTNYDGPGGMDLIQSANFIKEYTSLVKKRSYIKGLWWYDLIDDGTDIKNKEHNFGFFKNNLEPKASAKFMMAK